MSISKTMNPMQGVHMRMNPKNGFLVFELHYSADPAKRDKEYIRQIRESMPTRQFKQEYELQWDSYEGLSVYSDWDLSLHGVHGDIEPQLGLPLLLGFDFGLTPACLVAQLQEETLCCLKEFTAINMGAERFMAWIGPQLQVMFHQWRDPAKDYLVFIDPSGMFRKDTDEETCAGIISKSGFKNLIPGPVGWDERKGSVEKFLTKRTRRGPAFKVSIPNCPILFRGFQGGYRFDEKVLESEPNKLRPKKDRFSHIQDALQMIAARIMLQRSSGLVEVPRVNYSWSFQDPQETINYGPKHDPHSSP